MLGHPGASTFQAAMPDHTPPPGGAAAPNAQRQGVAINDIVGPASQKQQSAAPPQAPQMREERTSTDSTMLSALKRGPV